MLPRDTGVTANVSSEDFMGALMLKLRLVESALFGWEKGEEAEECIQWLQGSEKTCHLVGYFEYSCCGCMSRGSFKAGKCGWGWKIQ